MSALDESTWGTSKLIFDDTPLGWTSTSDTGATYYHHWLAALERLVAETGAASRDEQERTREAWRRAAHRTPHGHPIDLHPDDF